MCNYPTPPSRRAHRTQEERFISLRCPGCLAQVNVTTRTEFARCRMCGQQWNWRKSRTKRLALGRS